MFWNHGFIEGKFLAWLERPSILIYVGIAVVFYRAGFVVMDEVFRGEIKVFVYANPSQIFEKAPFVSFQHCFIEEQI